MTFPHIAKRLETKTRRKPMKRALVLVDIQNDYFPGGRKPLPGMAGASGRAADLLSHFRGTGQPLFHVRHIATSPNATFFVPETNGIQIHSSVAPLPEEEVITKNHPNSFIQTSLLDKLRRVDPERVIICGAMSNMCIDATTRAASDLGFKCVVVHDACAASDLKFGDRIVTAVDVHAAFMAALGAAYAGVMTLAEFLTGVDR
jgi:nicotinamidase-related amidase